MAYKTHTVSNVQDKKQYFADKVNASEVLSTDRQLQVETSCDTSVCSLLSCDTSLD